jgi:Ser/Thr protein kinase RdoA (MazF antagonist)
MTAERSASSSATLAPPSLAELQQAADMILTMVDIQGPARLTRLSGGANNRVYRVDVPKGSLVLKAYFQHENDPRDRLDAEFTFLKQLWAMGLRCIPQPVARLPLRQLAMYGHLAGDVFKPGNVHAGHVDQVAAFIRAINGHRDEFAGQDHDPQLIVEQRPCLAWASDACFSLADHLIGIEARMSRLLALPGEEDITHQAVSFVTDELLPAWSAAASHARQEATAQNLDLRATTPAADRLLSPSDLGFHNALLLSDDVVAFIDFEYAGWDDPAKLVCDFFTQTAVPVPHEHLPAFTQAIAALLRDPQRFEAHVKLLLPLYQLKWCAMALNPLLPVSQAKRAFLARDLADESQTTAAALTQAKSLFKAYQHSQGKSAN